MQFCKTGPSRPYIPRSHRVGAKSLQMQFCKHICISMQGCKRWRRRWQASHVFQRPALISFIMLLVLIKSMGAIIVKAQQVGRLPDDEGSYFFCCICNYAYKTETYISGS
jgi:hypothetical protein